MIVRVDPRYFRPTEVEYLLGDSTKARDKLGWVPQISLRELIAEMVKYDLVQAKKNKLIREHGFALNEQEGENHKNG